MSDPDRELARSLGLGRARVYVASFAMDCAAFCFFVFLGVHAEHGLGLDARTSGLLGTTTTGALALASFASGWILSRRRRLRLHLVGALWILGIALPVAYLGAGLPSLFAAGALFGVGLGLYWPSLESTLTRTARPRELWRVLGTFNLFWAAGIAIGALGGSSLYDLLGSRLSLHVSAGGAALAFVLLCPQVPATRSEVATAPLVVDDAPSPRLARAFLRSAWIANFAAMFSLHGINFMLPHIRTHLGFDLQELGLTLFVLYSTRWLAFLLLRRTDAWHNSRAWLFGLQSVAILGLVAESFVTQLPLFIVLLAGLGVFASLSYYSSLYYGLAVPDREGAHSSLHEGILSLGMMAGPLVCGEVARRFDERPSVVFAAAALVLLVALLWEARLLARARSG